MSASCWRASLWLFTALVFTSSFTSALAADDDQATEALWLSDHAKLVHKVKTLVVGDVDLKDVTINQALDFLQRQSKIADPDHLGINFVSENQASLDSFKFSVRLKYATVEEVLEQIPMMGHVIGDFVVELHSDKGDGIYSRTFKVPDNVLAINPTMLIDKDKLIYDVRPLFQANGIDFRPGESAIYTLPEKTLNVILVDYKKSIRMDEFLVFGFKNVK